jgi:thiamine biosynthesis protein ThiI
VAIYYAEQGISATGILSGMSAPAYIFVHYHELWLKQGNRRFFLHQLRQALKRALEGIPFVRITQPGDRYIIELNDSAHTEGALQRLSRVLGISHYGVARTLLWTPNADSWENIAEAGWQEIKDVEFLTFAVRAKRSDKRFPYNAVTIERQVGGLLLDRLVAAGRTPRVDLKRPELTCRIEVTRGPILVYAKRIKGVGGLPANTAGRLTCLLSGGFDSAVAAYKMMKRGAHVSFVHFWAGGAAAGESSIHVARRLVEQLTPWQGTAKLYLVPFEELQREIVGRADEKYRILLYRRLMLRIAQRIAMREKSKGIITGDSLGQVASQTLQNLQSVGAIARLPLYRPLIGDDKLEIQRIAAEIGTFDISAERFHDCCPVYLPKSPALFATEAMLDLAETSYDVEELVHRGLKSMAREHYRFTEGRVERTAKLRAARA